MLRKAESYFALFNCLQIENKTIIKDYEEEVSEMSEQSSTRELCVYFYLRVASAKSKTYKKLRRHIICSKLVVAFNEYCNKAYYYLVSGKKYNCACLIDYIEKM